MAPVLSMCLVLFLSLTSHSSATYCICKTGQTEQALQKTLDYACGAGADCSPILQTGACYQPNTIQDHCNYAVNSYFQKKGQVSGSCDFSGAATPSTTAPTVSGSCVYPSSSTSTTPTTTTTSPTNGTPTSNTTASPSTTTATPSTTTTTTGITPSVYGTGISPTGTSITDASGGREGTKLSYALVLLTLWFSGFFLWG